MAKSPAALPRAALQPVDHRRPARGARPSGVTMRKSGASAAFAARRSRRMPSASRNQATKKACSSRVSSIGARGQIADCHSGDLVEVVFHDRAMAAGAVALQREGVALRAPAAWRAPRRSRHGRSREGNGSERGIGGDMRCGCGRRRSPRPPPAGRAWRGSPPRRCPCRGGRRSAAARAAAPGTGTSRRNRR